MSYVNKRTRVFQDSNKIELLHVRSEGRMKSYPSATDVRAWSDIIEERRQHILDHQAKAKVGLPPEKIIPVDVLIEAIETFKNEKINQLEKRIEYLEKMLDIYSQLDLTPEQQKKLDKLKKDLKRAYDELSQLNDDICICTACFDIPENKKKLLQDAYTRWSKTKKPRPTKVEICICDVCHLRPSLIEEGEEPDTERKKKDQQEPTKKDKPKKPLSDTAPGTSKKGIGTPKSSKPDEKDYQKGDTPLHDQEPIRDDKGGKVAPKYKGKPIGESSPDRKDRPTAKGTEQTSPKRKVGPLTKEPDSYKGKPKVKGSEDEPAKSKEKALPVVKLKDSPDRTKAKRSQPDDRKAKRDRPDLKKKDEREEEQPSDEIIEGVMPDSIERKEDYARGIKAVPKAKTEPSGVGMKPKTEAEEPDTTKDKRGRADDRKTKEDRSSLKEKDGRDGVTKAPIKEVRPDSTEEKAVSKAKSEPDGVGIKPKAKDDTLDASKGKPYSSGLTGKPRVKDDGPVDAKGKGERLEHTHSKSDRGKPDSTKGKIVHYDDTAAKAKFESDGVTKPTPFEKREPGSAVDTLKVKEKGSVVTKGTTQMLGDAKGQRPETKRITPKEEAVPESALDKSKIKDDSSTVLKEKIQRPDDTKGERLGADIGTKVTPKGIAEPYSAAGKPKQADDVYDVAKDKSLLPGDAKSKAAPTDKTDPGKTVDKSKPKDDSQIQRQADRKVTEKEDRDDGTKVTPKGKPESGVPIDKSKLKDQRPDAPKDQSQGPGDIKAKRARPDDAKEQGDRDDGIKVTPKRKPEPDGIVDKSKPKDKEQSQIPDGIIPKAARPDGTEGKRDQDDSTKVKPKRKPEADSAIDKSKPKDGFIDAIKGPQIPGDAKTKKELKEKPEPGSVAVKPKVDTKTVPKSKTASDEKADKQKPQADDGTIKIKVRPDDTNDRTDIKHTTKEKFQPDSVAPEEKPDDAKEKTTPKRKPGSDEMTKEKDIGRLDVAKEKIESVRSKKAETKEKPVVDKSKGRDDDAETKIGKPALPDDVKRKTKQDADRKPIPPEKSQAIDDGQTPIKDDKKMKLDRDLDAKAQLQEEPKQDGDKVIDDVAKEKGKRPDDTQVKTTKVEPSADTKKKPESLEVKGKRPDDMKKKDTGFEDIKVTGEQVVDERPGGGKEKSIKETKSKEKYDPTRDKIAEPKGETKAKVERPVDAKDKTRLLGDAKETSVRLESKAEQPDVLKIKTDRPEKIKEKTAPLTSTKETLPDASKGKSDFPAGIEKGKPSPLKGKGELPDDGEGKAERAVDTKTKDERSDKAKEKAKGERSDTRAEERRLEDILTKAERPDEKGKGKQPVDTKKKDARPDEVKEKTKRERPDAKEKAERADTKETGEQPADTTKKDERPDEVKEKLKREPRDIREKDAPLVDIKVKDEQIDEKGKGERPEAKERDEQFVHTKKKKERPDEAKEIAKYAEEKGERPIDTKKLDKVKEKAGPDAGQKDEYDDKTKVKRELPHDIKVKESKGKEEPPYDAKVEESKIKEKRPDKLKPKDGRSDTKKIGEGPFDEEIKVKRSEEIKTKKGRPDDRKETDTISNGKSPEDAKLKSKGPDDTIGVAEGIADKIKMERIDDREKDSTAKEQKATEGRPLVTPGEKLKAEKKSKKEDAEEDKAIKDTSKKTGPTEAKKQKLVADRELTPKEDQMVKEKVKEKPHKEEFFGDIEDKYTDQKAEKETMVKKLFKEKEKTSPEDKLREQLFEVQALSPDEEKILKEKLDEQQKEDMKKELSPEDKHAKEKEEMTKKLVVDSKLIPEKEKLIQDQLKTEPEKEDLKQKLFGTKELSAKEKEMLEDKLEKEKLKKQLFGERKLTPKEEKLLEEKLKEKRLEDKLKKSEAKKELTSQEKKLQEQHLKQQLKEEIYGDRKLSPEEERLQEGKLKEETLEQEVEKRKKKILEDKLKTKTVKKTELKQKLFGDKKLTPEEEKLLEQKLKEPEAEKEALKEKLFGFRELTTEEEEILEDKLKQEQLVAELKTREEKEKLLKDKLEKDKLKELLPRDKKLTPEEEKLLEDKLKKEQLKEKLKKDIFGERKLSPEEEKVLTKKLTEALAEKEELKQKLFGDKEISPKEKKILEDKIKQQHLKRMKKEEEILEKEVKQKEKLLTSKLIEAQEREQLKEKMFGERKLPHEEEKLLEDKLKETEADKDKLKQKLFGDKKLTSEGKKILEDAVKEKHLKELKKDLFEDEELTPIEKAVLDKKFKDARDKREELEKDKELIPEQQKILEDKLKEDQLKDQHKKKLFGDKEPTSQDEKVLEIKLKEELKKEDRKKKLFEDRELTPTEEKLLEDKFKSAETEREKLKQKMFGDKSLTLEEEKSLEESLKAQQIKEEPKNKLFGDRELTEDEENILADKLKEEKLKKDLKEKFFGDRVLTHAEEKLLTDKVKEAKTKKEKLDPKKLARQIFGDKKLTLEEEKKLSDKLKEEQLKEKLKQKLFGDREVTPEEKKLLEDKLKEAQVVKEELKRQLFGDREVTLDEEKILEDKFKDQQHKAELKEELKQKLFGDKELTAEEEKFLEDNFKEQQLKDELKKKLFGDRKLTLQEEKILADKLKEEKLKKELKEKLFGDKELTPYEEKLLEDKLKAAEAEKEELKQKLFGDRKLTPEDEKILEDKFKEQQLKDEIKKELFEDRKLTPEKEKILADKLKKEKLKQELKQKLFGDRELTPYEEILLEDKLKVAEDEKDVLKEQLLTEGLKKELFGDAEITPEEEKILEDKLREEKLPKDKLEEAEAEREDLKQKLFGDKKLTAEEEKILDSQFKEQQLKEELKQKLFGDKILTPEEKKILEDTLKEELFGDRKLTAEEEKILEKKLKEQKQKEQLKKQLFGDRELTPDEEKILQHKLKEELLKLDLKQKLFGDRELIPEEENVLEEQLKYLEAEKEELKLKLFEDKELIPEEEKMLEQILKEELKKQLFGDRELTPEEKKLLEDKLKKEQLKQELKQKLFGDKELSSDDKKLLEDKFKESEAEKEEIKLKLFGDKELTSKEEQILEDKFKEQKLKEEQLFGDRELTPEEEKLLEDKLKEEQLKQKLFGDRELPPEEDKLPKDKLKGLEPEKEDLKLKLFGDKELTPEEEELLEIKLETEKEKLKQKLFLDRELIPEEHKLKEALKQQLFGDREFTPEDQKLLEDKFREEQLRIKLKQSLFGDRELTPGEEKLLEDKLKELEAEKEKLKLFGDKELTPEEEQILEDRFIEQQLKDMLKKQLFGDRELTPEEEKILEDKLKEALRKEELKKKLFGDRDLTAEEEKLLDNTFKAREEKVQELKQKLFGDKELSLEEENLLQDKFKEQQLRDELKKKLFGDRDLTIEEEKLVDEKVQQELRKDELQKLLFGDKKLTVEEEKMLEDKLKEEQLKRDSLKRRLFGDKELTSSEEILLDDKIKELAEKDVLRTQLFGDKELTPDQERKLDKIFKKQQQQREKLKKSLFGDMPLTPEEEQLLEDLFKKEQLKFICKAPCAPKIEICKHPPCKDKEKREKSTQFPQKKRSITLVDKSCDALCAPIKKRKVPDKSDEEKLLEDAIREQLAKCMFGNKKLSPDEEDLLNEILKQELRKKKLQKILFGEKETTAEEEIILKDKLEENLKRYNLKRKLFSDRELTPSEENLLDYKLKQLSEKEDLKQQLFGDKELTPDEERELDDILRKQQQQKNELKAALFGDRSLTSEEEQILEDEFKKIQEKPKFICRAPCVSRPKICKHPPCKDKKTVKKPFQYPPKKACDASCAPMEKRKVLDKIDEEIKKDGLYHDEEQILADALREELKKTIFGDRTITSEEENLLNQKVKEELRKEELQNRLFNKKRLTSEEVEILENKLKQEDLKRATLKRNLFGDRKLTPTEKKLLDHKLKQNFEKEELKRELFGDKELTLNEEKILESEFRKAQGKDKIICKAPCAPTLKICKQPPCNDQKNIERSTQSPKKETAIFVDKACNAPCVPMKKRRVLDEIDEELQKDDDLYHKKSPLEEKSNKDTLKRHLFGSRDLTPSEEKILDLSLNDLSEKEDLKNHLFGDEELTPDKEKELEDLLKKHQQKHEIKTMLFGDRPLTPEEEKIVEDEFKRSQGKFKLICKAPCSPIAIICKHPSCKSSQVPPKTEPIISVDKACDAACSSMKKRRVLDKIDELTQEEKNILDEKVEKKKKIFDKLELVPEECKILEYKLKEVELKRDNLKIGLFGDRVLTLSEEKILDHKIKNLMEKDSQKQLFDNVELTTNEQQELEDIFKKKQQKDELKKMLTPQEEKILEDECEKEKLICKAPCASTSKIYKYPPYEDQKQVDKSAQFPLKKKPIASVDQQCDASCAPIKKRKVLANIDEEDKFLTDFVITLKKTKLTPISDITCKTSCGNDEQKRLEDLLKDELKKSFFGEKKLTSDEEKVLQKVLKEQLEEDLNENLIENNEINTDIRLVQKQFRKDLFNDRPLSYEEENVPSKLSQRKFPPKLDTDKARSASCAPVEKKHLDNILKEEIKPNIFTDEQLIPENKKIPQSGASQNDYKPLTPKDQQISKNKINEEKTKLFQQPTCKYLCTKSLSEKGIQHLGKDLLNKTTSPQKIPVKGRKLIVVDRGVSPKQSEIRYKFRQHLSKLCKLECKELQTEKSFLAKKQRHKIVLDKGVSAKSSVIQDDKCKGPCKINQERPQVDQLECLDAIDDIKENPLHSPPDQICKAPCVPKTPPCSLQCLENAAKLSPEASKKEYETSEIEPSFFSPHIETNENLLRKESFPGISNKNLPKSSEICEALKKEYETPEIKPSSFSPHIETNENLLLTKSFPEISDENLPKISDEKCNAPCAPKLPPCFLQCLETDSNKSLNLDSSKTSEAPEKKLKEPFGSTPPSNETNTQQGPREVSGKQDLKTTSPKLFNETSPNISKESSKAYQENCKASCKPKPPPCSLKCIKSKNMQEIIQKKNEEYLLAIESDTDELPFVDAESPIESGAEEPPFFDAEQTPRSIDMLKLDITVGNHDRLPVMSKEIRTRDNCNAQCGQKQSESDQNQFITDHKICLNNNKVTNNEIQIEEVENKSNLFSGDVYDSHSPVKKLADVKSELVPRSTKILEEEINIDQLKQLPKKKSTKARQKPPIAPLFSFNETDDEELVALIEPCKASCKKINKKSIQTDDKQLLDKKSIGDQIKSLKKVGPDTKDATIKSAERDPVSKHIDTDQSEDLFSDAIDETLPVPDTYLGLIGTTKAEADIQKKTSAQQTLPLKQPETKSFGLQLPSPVASRLDTPPQKPLDILPSVSTLKDERNLVKENLGTKSDSSARNKDLGDDESPEKTSILLTGKDDGIDENPLKKSPPEEEILATDNNVEGKIPEIKIIPAKTSGKESVFEDNISLKDKSPNFDKEVTRTPANVEEKRYAAEDKKTTVSDKILSSDREVKEKSLDKSAQEEDEYLKTIRRKVIAGRKLTSKEKVMLMISERQEKEKKLERSSKKPSKDLTCVCSSSEKQKKSKEPLLTTCESYKREKSPSQTSKRFLKPAKDENKRTPSKQSIKTERAGNNLDFKKETPKGSITSQQDERKRIPSKQSIIMENTRNQLSDEKESPKTSISSQQNLKEDEALLEEDPSKKIKVSSPTSIEKKSSKEHPEFKDTNVDVDKKCIGVCADRLPLLNLKDCDATCANLLVEDETKDINKLPKTQPISDELISKLSPETQTLIKDKSEQTIKKESSKKFDEMEAVPEEDEYQNLISTKKYKEDEPLKHEKFESTGDGDDELSYNEDDEKDVLHEGEVQSTTKKKKIPLIQRILKVKKRGKEVDVPAQEKYKIPSEERLKRENSIESGASISKDTTIDKKKSSKETGIQPEPIIDKESIQDRPDDTKKLSGEIGIQSEPSNIDEPDDNKKPLEEIGIQLETENIEDHAYDKKKSSTESAMQPVPSIKKESVKLESFTEPDIPKQESTTDKKDTSIISMASIKKVIQESSELIADRDVLKESHTHTEPQISSNIAPYKHTCKASVFTKHLSELSEHIEILTQQVIINKDEEKIQNQLSKQTSCELPCRAPCSSKTKIKIGENSNEFKDIPSKELPKPKEDVDPPSTQIHEEIKVAVIQAEEVEKLPTTKSATTDADKTIGMIEKHVQTVCTGVCAYQDKNVQTHVCSSFLYCRCKFNNIRRRQKLPVMGPEACKGACAPSTIAERTSGCTSKCNASSSTHETTSTQDYPNKEIIPYNPKVYNCLNTNQWQFDHKPFVPWSVDVGNQEIMQKIKEKAVMAARTGLFVIFPDKEQITNSIIPRGYFAGETSQENAISRKRPKRTYKRSPIYSRRVLEDSQTDSDDNIKPPLILTYQVSYAESEISSEGLLERKSVKINPSTRISRVLLGDSSSLNPVKVCTRNTSTSIPSLLSNEFIYDKLSNAKCSTYSIDSWRDGRPGNLTTPGTAVSLPSSLTRREPLPCRESFSDNITYHDNLSDREIFIHEERRRFDNISIDNITYHDHLSDRDISDGDRQSLDIDSNRDMSYRDNISDGINFERTKNGSDDHSEEDTAGKGCDSHKRILEDKSLSDNAQEDVTYGSYLIARINLEEYNNNSKEDVHARDTISNKNFLHNISENKHSTDDEQYLLKIEFIDRDTDMSEKLYSNEEQYKKDNDIVDNTTEMSERTNSSDEPVNKSIHVVDNTTEMSENTNSTTEEQYPTIDINVIDNTTEMSDKDSSNDERDKTIKKITNVTEISGKDNSKININIIVNTAEIFTNETTDEEKKVALIEETKFNERQFQMLPKGETKKDIQELTTIFEKVTNNENVQVALGDQTLNENDKIEVVRDSEPPQKKSPAVDVCTYTCKKIFRKFQQNAQFPKHRDLSDRTRSKHDNNSSSITSTLTTISTDTAGSVREKILCEYSPLCQHADRDEVFEDAMEDIENTDNTFDKNLKRIYLQKSSDTQQFVEVHGTVPRLNIPDLETTYSNRKPKKTSLSKNIDNTKNSSSSRNKISYNTKNKPDSPKEYTRSTYYCMSSTRRSNMMSQNYKQKQIVRQVEDTSSHEISQSSSSPKPKKYWNADKKEEKKNSCKNKSTTCNGIEETRYETLQNKNKESGNKKEGSKRNVAKRYGDRKTSKNNKSKDGDKNAYDKDGRTKGSDKIVKDDKKDEHIHEIRPSILKGVPQDSKEDLPALLIRKDTEIIALRNALTSECEEIIPPSNDETRKFVSRGN